MKEDMDLVDEVYEENKHYLDDLRVYIGGGEKKEEEIESERLGELRGEGEETDNEMDVEGMGDMEEFEEGLSKGI
ncbi:toxic anion resistance protein, partial [Staphylococcus pettenkoferi]|uniref:toxic anion resistance protein n=1 Tax=Staphylococcus pettenkoferi TaxID=170573 RepID=UPI001642E439